MVFRNKDNKVFVIVATCVVFLLLASVIVYSIIRERQDTLHQAEYEQYVQQLRKKHSDLMLEYSSLEEREYKKLGCSAALSIIIEGVDKALYDEIFPIVSSSSGKEAPALKGIICLSSDEMPGNAGKITEGQFKEMLNAGWTAAVSWDGKSELGEYLEAMRYNFECMGVPVFDTVLFWGNTYNDSLDEVLLDNGVQYALHNKVGMYPLVEQRVESEGLLLPGYIGWNNRDGKGARYVYDYLLTRGGVSSFIVNFPNSSSEAYYADHTMNFTSTDECKASFKRLVENNLLVEYNKGNIVVGSFDDVFSVRKDFLKAKEAAQPRIEAMKADLLRQIEDVEKAIMNAYYEYNGD